VVTPALADKKGVVRIDIPFSPAEAALSRTGVTVSKTTLTVPEKARLKYVEADRRLNKQDAEGARKALEEAVKIAPQYTAAWNFLGVLACQGGDLDRAEEHFRRGLGGRARGLRAETEPGRRDDVLAGFCRKLWR